MTIFSLGAVPGSRGSTRPWCSGGVPGVWDGRVGREGYTGTQPAPVPDPNISHILALSPTYGQMKENYWYFMRFPEMGLE